MKGWKKIFHANRDQKKAGVAILISDKIDFKTKAVKRDKEGHYIMIKGSIQEEDITIINIYAPNIGAPRYVRQMLTSMKGEINNIGTLGGLVTVLVIHDGAHLVDALHELGLALDLTVGVVVFERPVGHVVFELPYVHEFSALVLLPNTLLLAVLIGHIDPILREKDNRQE